MCLLISQQAVFGLTKRNMIKLLSQIKRYNYIESHDALENQIEFLIK